MTEPEAAETSRADNTLLFVFDADCGLCSRFAWWLDRHSARGRIRTMAAQTPGLLQRLGLSQADVDAAAWTVTAGGRRLRGAAAINHLLAVSLPGPWPLLASLYQLAPIRWLEDRGYAWVAAHRGRVCRRRERRRHGASLAQGVIADTDTAGQTD